MKTRLTEKQRRQRLSVLASRHEKLVRQLNAVLASIKALGTSRKKHHA